jgi:hypothetical protein
MRMEPILAQIDDLPFVTKGGALEYAALKSLPGRLPAIYAVPQLKSASPIDRATRLIDQKVQAMFALVLILPPSQRIGAAERISDQLDTLERDVIDRIVGWTHPDASSPCEFADATSLSTDGTAFVWAMRFRCSYHIRKVQ